MSKHLPSDFEHQQKYTEAIQQARLAGEQSFHSWFNVSQDVRQTIFRGYWDFTVHILTPTVSKYLQQPEEKVALEIGYGGGRLLNAACSYFKEAIGVDIHSDSTAVEAFLTSQGKSNFKLIHTGGRTLEMGSDSVDFIYSFIVLQHLPAFEVFQSYLQETYRCLRSRGIAQLYFGKFSKISPMDRLLNLTRGYKEIPEAPVNFTSLVISVWKAKWLSRQTGFRVLEIGTSYKSTPDGRSRKKGGQNYITLLKK